MVKIYWRVAQLRANREVTTSQVFDTVRNLRLAHFFAALSVLTVSGCTGSQTSKKSGFSIPYLGYTGRASICHKNVLKLHGDRAVSGWSSKRIISVPAPIVPDLLRAARATGVSSEYLAITASRESSFRVGVKARSSSAEGLFQFVDQTWLRLVAMDGHCHGLGSIARHIRRSPRGRYFVASPVWKHRILNLRRNAYISSVMAGRLTRRNALSFAKQSGRRPTYDDLYIAHFLGAGSAARLAIAVRHRPNTRADLMFRAAASANPRIFYDRGRPRTVWGVYKELTRSHSKVSVVYTKPRSTLVGRAWRFVMPK